MEAEQSKMADVSEEPDIEKAVRVSIQQTLDDLADETGDVPLAVFTVPSFLRRVRGFLRYYKPTVVSIGPNHRGKLDLKPMNDHKTRFLRDLLSRAEGKNLELCVAEIMKLEQRARSCYAETESVRLLDKEKLVEILVMDGCFIIELLYKSSFQASKLKVSRAWNWRRNMWIDLLRLENQIPFFVLETLFELLVAPEIKARNGSRHQLRDLAVTYVMKGQTEFQSTSTSIKHEGFPEVDHLLHLFYLSVISSQVRRSCGISCGVPPVDNLILFLQIQNILMAIIFSPHRFLKYILTKAGGCVSWACSTTPRRNSCPSESSKTIPWVTIPCVTQLQEDGVKFTKKRNSNGLLDITFSRGRGIMKIPQLSIDSETMALLANLIAYEVCKGNKGEKYMISYALLMDCLIDSPMDVAVLREHEIIVSTQEDKDLADFFNQIGKSCDLTNAEYHFAHLSGEVMEYCKFKLFRWRTYFRKLKRDYFSTPWALCSFLAAAILLVVTIAQTVFTVYPYYHPRS